MERTRAEQTYWGLKQDPILSHSIHDYLRQQLRISNVWQAIEALYYFSCETMSSLTIFSSPTFFALTI